MIFLFKWVIFRLLLLMAEILHQLIGGLSHYLQGFGHPRWLFGISSHQQYVNFQWCFFVNSFKDPSPTTMACDFSLHAAQLEELPSDRMTGVVGQIHARIGILS